MNKYLLFILLSASPAFAQTAREDFEQARDAAQVAQRAVLANLHAEVLLERANAALAKANLAPRDFAIDQRGPGETYLRSLKTVCKLNYGHKTVSGLDCGAVTGLMSSFGMETAACEEDYAPSDALDCYPVLAKKE